MCVLSLLQADWMPLLLCIETRRVWWPSWDSGTTRGDGMVRQEADGICSYQPPSGTPKTFVYYTPKCQHTRLPTKPSVKTTRLSMCGCQVLPDKACGWQAPRHPSLLKQLNQCDGPRTGQPPSQQPLQNSVLSASAMLSWLIPREPTALAPLTGCL